MPSAENTAAPEQREEQVSAEKAFQLARTAKGRAVAAERRRERAADPDYTKNRFLKKVNKDGPVPARRPELGPCWVWTAARFAEDYGAFAIGGRTLLAHRVSHELFVGPIPENYEVDHLCVNRPCVNPGHLEAVTSQVNNLRSGSVSAVNAARTHCKRGHPFDEQNTMLVSSGRECRACYRKRLEKQNAADRLKRSLKRNGGENS